MITTVPAPIICIISCMIAAAPNVHTTVLSACTKIHMVQSYMHTLILYKYRGSLQTLGRIYMNSRQDPVCVCVQWLDWRIPEEGLYNWHVESRVLVTFFKITPGGLGATSQWSCFMLLGSVYQFSRCEHGQLRSSFTKPEGRVPNRWGTGMLVNLPVRLMSCLPLNQLFSCSQPLCTYL